MYLSSRISSLWRFSFLLLLSCYCLMNSSLPKQFDILPKTLYLNWMIAYLESSTQFFEMKIYLHRPDDLQRLRKFWVAWYSRFKDVTISPNLVIIMEDMLEFSSFNSSSSWLYASLVICYPLQSNLWKMRLLAFNSIEVQNRSWDHHLSERMQINSSPSPPVSASCFGELESG